MHALVDGEGRPYAVLVTGGQVADIHGARALVAASPAPASFIADKAYDADDLRHYLEAQGTKVVISLMPNRKRLPDFDPIAYRARNIIERAFCKLKDWRGFATRYDKLARNFLAATCLAAAVTYWIK